MATASSIRTGCRFGPFALDLRSGDLTRNGRPVRLQEKPRNVLIALAERPGQLITRTELHDRLWPNDTFVDFEDGLNTAMSKLREALGDDIQSPRYIETVRGRGYRFIARVEQAPSPGLIVDSGPSEEKNGNPAEPAESPSPVIPSEVRDASISAPAGLHRGLGLKWFLLGSLVAVSAGAAWYWLAKSHAVLSYSRNDPVLVADFDNQTGDPRLDKALGTALNVSLGQSRYVRVYSRLQIDNVLRLMTRRQDDPVTPEIGREICQRESIRALIVPAITRTGSNYMLTAQLFNPSTGEVLRSYAERAHGNDEILPALDTISAQIRRDLGESRYEIYASTRPLPQVTTASLQALQLYAEGVSLFGRGQAVQAVARYKAAIAIDPSFAMAHAALGYAWYSFYFNQPILGQQEFRAALALESRTTSRERAFIEIRDAESEGRTREAMDLYRSYLVRWPADWDARYFYARLLRMNGRAADAIAEYQRLLQDTPNDPGVYIEMATAWRALGQLSRSIQCYDKAFALDSQELRNTEVILEYGDVLLADGQEERAVQAYSSLLSEPDTYAHGERGLAFIDLYQGRYTSARQRLQLALAKSQDPFSVARIHYMLSVVAAGLGDRKEEVAQLDRIAGALNTIGPKVIYGALLGQAYVRAGEIARAKQILAEIAPLVNERADDQVAYMEMLKAEIAGASGDSNAALQFMKPLPPDGPTAANAVTQESLAHLYQSEGKRAEAIAWYQQFLNRGNSFAIGWEPQQQIFDAYYIVAQDYWVSGDRDNALSMLSKLLDRWKTADSNLPLLREARLLRDQITAGH